MNGEALNNSAHDVKYKNAYRCCGVSTARYGGLSTTSAVLWVIGLTILVVNLILLTVFFRKYEDSRCDIDPNEPPVPGAMPGLSKPKVILAMDVDYPPYA